MTDTTPSFMPTDNRPQNAGSSMHDDASRLDAVEKVTGQARYGRDVYIDGGLYAKFIRCPYGAADLESHDRDAALAVDGVVDLEIERERGRYEGHAVGWIAAESPLAVERGLRALNATWKIGDFKHDLAAGADAAPDSSNATNKLLDGCEHTLEATYSTPVQTHSPLETHGASIEWRADGATVYASTQGTFATRDGLDRVIGLPRSQYEVVCEYVGGGFGSKLNGAGPEGMTAARIANKYKRSVYLFTDRAEDHLDTGNRPSSRTTVRVGFDADGRIRGGHIHTWGGVGVGRGGGGVSFPSRRYGLGDLQRTHQDVQFNAGTPRAFRAPGAPQGAFAEELMLDEVATIAGVDPLDLRMRLDGEADRRAMYELGAKRIGWSRREPTGRDSNDTIRRGFGMGSASWGRFPSRADAEVVIHSDGSVEARSGTQDIGTGQRTVMGVVAADGLGIPLERVTVQLGRSSLPVGPGSGGSVTAHNSAPAMAAAATDARTQLLDVVAGRVGVDADQLEVVDGMIVRPGGSPIAWNDACGMLGDSIMGRGSWSRRSRGSDRTKGHSHGAQFAEVTVDIETGVIAVERVVAVQACGRVVCRKTAESQIIGGVIQGLSYALFEDKILDPQLGAMVNPNFEWYRIAGAGDMPLIEPVLWTSGQTGVRSLGEPPTIPTAGAIACAVFNAIGTPVRDLPLAPHRVLAAVHGETV